jgi:cytochrome bd-type quinol oxidase subunit 2
MNNPLIWSIVLPLLFGLLSCAIAAHKNRSRPGWFFAGVLLGPFGLLVAFFPRIQPHETERSDIASDLATGSVGEKK